MVAAIDRFQLQRATAIGSGIVLSLATIFPDAGIDLSQVTGARRCPRRWANAKPEKEFKPVEPGSYDSAAIILLTDGQRTTGPDPIDAAKMAADRGVKVYTVGIGTKEGETIGFEGWSMRVRLDEETLKQVANVTRAEYFYAGTALDLKKVYQSLGSRLSARRRRPRSARCSPPPARCSRCWPRACRSGGSGAWRDHPRSGCAAPPQGGVASGLAEPDPRRPLSQAGSALTVLAWLDDDAPFPPTAHALGPDSDAPGLLAAGGRLTVARLEEAYRRGIFPWYSRGQPVLWWSPDPRMVLPSAQFRLHRSLRKTLRRFLAHARLRAALRQRLRAGDRTCARRRRAPASAAPGSCRALRRAYTAWHHAGGAHSVETWIDGELVGGLYGVGIGRMFFGESMFAHATDASKIALAALVAFCRGHGIALIDCQQATAHLASFGAREMPRAVFEEHLAQALSPTGAAGLDL